MLVILLVVIWAISWPVIKVGVASVHPLWYAFLRYAVAASCLFVFVGWRRELGVPPRSDWRLVAVSGALQMAAYSALTAIALTVLPAGRASVLAFSTPLWVAPLSACYLREAVHWPVVCAVALGLAGILLIAAPALRHLETRQVQAYGLLLVAAACWAVSIVFVRAHRFTASPLALAPWQMLVAAILVLPFAAGFGGRWRGIDFAGAASLAYVAPIGTAFAYWAVVEAGRRIHPNTIAMALLSVPALGIVVSAMTLGETLDASLAGGIVLIAIGIRLATLAPRSKVAQPAASESRADG